MGLDHVPGAFVDALGEGVYGIDLSGRCLFVNASALRILRYGRAEDLVGRDMHEAIHHTRPDGTPFAQTDCPLLHTARSGQSVRLENEMLWRRDGTSFFAEYSAYPVLAEGAIIGSVITFAENQVRQDARIRLAVQHAVSQVLARPARRGETLTQVLKTVAGGFGWNVGLFWRQDVATGKELRLAARYEAGDAGAAASFAAESTDAVLSGEAGLAARAWATRRPVHVPDLQAEPEDARLAAASRHGLRSGFAFPVATASTNFGAMEFYDREHIAVDGSLLEAVEVIGRMVGQALEQQIVARDLRRSEARFRTIANAIPQMAWMTAPDGAITWYNDRWYEFTGTTPQQMKGWGWMSVHHPDHLDRVERNLRASFAAGESWEDTFPLRAADGSYRWFLSRAMPIRAESDEGHPEGDILGWFGTNTDITALRAVEQTQTEALDEAEAANQAKSLFLANMSHELRTPLSAIIGYAEMLVEEVEDGAKPDEVVRDIRKVETNARHLLGLINDVLDLSKVESGKMEAYAETFDVASMVRDIAATVDSLIQKKRNQLELRIGDDVGSMHSDITRIRQVLLNLLSNAAKFTESGVITLAAMRKQGADGVDWLSFEVSDTGLGMSEEQLAKLFQRFQQADASTTRLYGGTGLGLSLTKAFSELLGGRVEVRSVPGQGSTFAMHIPANLPVASFPEVETQAVGEDGRQVVLVIDDDATQRELASRFLERTGYVARTAADGAAGLSLARSLHPHAILLDVTMPGMDGWSVLTALKADATLADIPVVMVTLMDERELASSLGAADYLVKPVNWGRLSLVLDRFRPADGDVLVVDDDADTRLRLRQALEKLGWTVAEAANGQVALDAIADSVPRLILLDLAMPVMDGFEFLGRLREQPGCGTVPVVVLTVLDLSLEDRRRLRGANQVLNKGSVSLNELTAKLSAISSLAAVK